MCYREFQRNGAMIIIYWLSVCLLRMKKDFTILLQYIATEYSSHCWFYYWFITFAYFLCFLVAERTMWKSHWSCWTRCCPSSRIPTRCRLSLSQTAHRRVTSPRMMAIWAWMADGKWFICPLSVAACMVGKIFYLGVFPHGQLS